MSNNLNFPTSTISNPFSQDGVSQIVDMFTSQTKKQKTKYITIIKEMYIHVEPQLSCKLVIDNKQRISTFINTYFMLCALQKCILIPQCEHSVSDKKIIRVIILAYKIYHIDYFIKNESVWRGNNLQNFIQYLKVLKSSVLVSSLKAERTTSLDLQYLLSTAKIFKDKNNNCLHYINLQEKLKFYQVNQTGVKSLFWSLVINMYQFLGRFQKQKLCLETIKLHLLYLNCITNLSMPKLKLQSPKSKLSYITRWKGFQTLDHYFSDLTLSMIVADKQHCRLLFTQIMDPISEVAQGQSDVTQPQNV